MTCGLETLGQGAGENRNVYTLTPADDVPRCRQSVGIILFRQKYLWELSGAAS